MTFPPKPKNNIKYKHYMFKELKEYILQCITYEDKYKSKRWTFFIADALNPTDFIVLI